MKTDGFVKVNKGGCRIPTGCSVKVCAIRHNQRSDKDGMLYLAIADSVAQDIFELGCNVDVFAKKTDHGICFAVARSDDEGDFVMCGGKCLHIRSGALMRIAERFGASVVPTGYIPCRHEVGDLDGHPAVFIFWQF